jgi:hypothetical protein
MDITLPDTTLANLTHDFLHLIITALIGGLVFIWFFNSQFSDSRGGYSLFTYQGGLDYQQTIYLLLMGATSIFIGHAFYSLLLLPFVQ